MAEKKVEKEEMEVCEICLGTGWIPVKEEGIEKVKRCSCFTELLKKKVISTCNIPERYSECTLDNYETHNSSQRTAKRIAEKFCKGYPGYEIGLFFVGPCGVGKTHLSVAILKNLIENKLVDGIFYDFWELLKSIQSTYSATSLLTESQIISPVIEKEIIILDDLGAQKVTDWRRDILTYILNKRYNEKKPTILSSNWHISADKDSNIEETLEDRIGTRLISRIYEMCRIVEITGNDYRKSFKQDGYRHILR
ncbi:MAG: hypothetical protein D6734_06445 [Candidatus Schekmanbacteria bacterium]|nr:MAG: hypothetical protein D6734_06445 [Candidatus Schekmanbacteria bacterium]